MVKVGHKEIKVFKRYISIGIIFLLASCATNYASRSADDIALATIIKDSDFDSQRRFTAPPIIIKESRGMLFVDFLYPRLRAFQDKSTSLFSYQLYIAITYTGDRRSYKWASLIGGEDVLLDRVSSKVDNCAGIACQFTEVVIMQLPDLRPVNAAFQVRINASSGHENIITVPMHYFEGFFAALDKFSTSQWKKKV